MSISKITIDCKCSYCLNEFDFVADNANEFNIFNDLDIFSLCEHCRTGIKSGGIYR